ncbi:hypothetical protein [Xanthomonas theicola]|uniref:hypothetical protein n=1 Tax=Xanthomonas theicola TaxID=56464 RepID=UPI001304AF56|nr:hypothetical protein [Xanthomonas theicola]QNH24512.1 hypothetical protein G4Q83_06765 [Xanthomonas theicola]
MRSQRALGQWRETVEQLARNRSSFATLSMQRLQEAAGPLDRLRARGYEVIAA